ncbi:MAG: hypothetical protein Q9179_006784 [Wetmoreana sp. 5 TL-2023]
MRSPAHLRLFWLLALATAGLANPFWYREEIGLPKASTSQTASAASTSATSAAHASAHASASASGTASPAAETTNVNPTSAAGTSTANGTAAATSSSSAAATASATPQCRIDHTDKPDNDTNPFCEPKQDQRFWVGEIVPILWDPTLFENNSTKIVELKQVNASSKILWNTAPLENEVGHTSLTIHPDYFQGNGTKVTLFIHSPGDTGNMNPTLSGPVFEILSNSTSTNQTSHGGNSSKELGEKAGIPVGLGVFLIAAAGLIFWFLRRRKNNSAGYMAKREGRTSRTMGAESRGGGGFRDEPTRGMELQDRGAHSRQDSWEAGWDTASSQGGGNTFRDEIDRQRRR